MKRIGIAVLLVVCGCRAIHPTFAKEHVRFVRVVDTGELLQNVTQCPAWHTCRDEGMFIYWRGPSAKNVPHVCAEVYRNDGDPYREWGGEFHRDGEASAYVIRFESLSDAERWGDAQCPVK